MKRILFCLALLIIPGVLAAKDKIAVSYPLPAGTPVEVIRDPQASIVLTRPVYGKYQQSPGGMFGASWLVDNNRKIEPLRAELLPAKIDEYFLRAVLANLPALVTSANPGIVDKAWTPEELLAKTQDSGGVYVAVRPLHAFSLGFDSLGAYVEVWVVRVDARSSGKGKETVLDHQMISFEQHFEGWHPGMARGSAMIWRLLGAKQVEAEFRGSIDQAAGMFAYQFSPEGQAEAKLKNQKHDGKVHGMKVPGRLVRSGPDWFWFREDYEDQLVGYGIIETSANAPATHED